MEIHDIKSKLTLSELIKHYGYKADKHNRICCPFHDDKTPSMQLYWKTHTAYCFSSNCKLKGKSIDVIDFVMHKENSTKHEAIEKCKSMITGEVQQTSNIAHQSKEQFLQKMFMYFRNAVHNSPQARECIAGRKLDYTKLEIGYNAAQFHHGARKDETLISQCLQYGLLIDKLQVSRTGDKAYTVFGKHCIAFALKNKAGQVAGLYFRSTVNETESKHFYLKDRSGIYPAYPKSTTKKIILTENIIDAATLLQIDAITASYSIIAAFGTNGFNEEIKKAIQELKQLDEIIFAFDSDEAGKAAVKKYVDELHTTLPNLVQSSLTTPLKDINETAQAHEDETIFTQLLEERTTLFLSIEKNESQQTTVQTMDVEENKTPAVAHRLNTKNPEQ